MSFESIGDSLARKDLDQNFDMVEFLALIKSIIKKWSGVEIDTVSFNKGLLRVSVSHPIEASEIRLKKIQIERSITKQTSQKITKFIIRVVG
jgi:hypothetical protein